MDKIDAAVIAEEIEPVDVEAAIEEHGWCGTFYGNERAVIMPNGANVGKEQREYLKGK